MPHDTDTGTAASDFPPGHVLLGRYRIEGSLGRGGMGEVLLARDLLLGRLVALKRLSPAEGEPDRRRASMIREARRASRIVHQRVAAIHDVIEVGDDVMLVMEHVEGITLRERLEDPVPLETFWNLAFQCAEGLAAAHARGVVHRDIKPSNLMLTGDGQIKILDFGVARRTVTSAPTTTTRSSVEAPDFAGTPEYMAPEVHLGAPADERADLFSLGAVFYEMLTGVRPFPGTTYAEVVHRVLNETPRAPASFGTAVPEGLSSLVERMLSKDRESRFASAEALIDALRRVRAGEGLPEAAGAASALSARGSTADPWRPVPPAAPRRTWRRAAGVAAAVALGAALVATWAFLRAPPLPADVQLAVLAPATTGEDRGGDFAGFALGFTQWIGHALHRRVALPRFQMASFDEGYEGDVRSADEARKVLGANVALTVTMTNAPDALDARFELIDTGSGRALRHRRVRGPASEPFEFARRARSEVEAMVGLPPGDDSLRIGIAGAGTLRFWLRGSGRLLAATDTASLRPALADLELASLAEPTSGAALARLAAAQLHAYSLSGIDEWLERARRTAERAVLLDSSLADSYRTLGLVLATLHEHRDALAAMNRAYRLDPTDDVAALRRARLYGRLGRKEEELAAYRQTIRSRPHCWQPYWWLATWFFREGRLDECVQAYRRMIERGPLVSKGYASLGGVLVLRGEYAQAIDTLRRSIELQPTRIAFGNLGTAYFNARRLEDAIAAYNQAFQFGFNDYSSWLNLGDAYYWRNARRDLAEDAYGQAVRMGREEILMRARSAHSMDVMIPANLATVFPKLGEPDSARVYLDYALQSGASNPMVEYCAALTLWQLNDRSGAFDWLDRSVGNGYPTVWLRDSPIFDEWRSDPRFTAIMARAGAGEAKPSDKGGA